MFSFLFVIALIVEAIALFDVAAARWGVDSRDGSADPRQPELGIFVR